MVDDVLTVDPPAGRVEALSPLKVLSRGYTITTRSDSDIPLQTAAGIEPGDLLTTRLRSGRLHSRVERVEQEENPDG